MIADDIFALANILWPLNRSITGEGVRETLRIIQKEIPSLLVYEVPCGTQVFDWTIPKEWRVRDAYITAPNGERFCEFKKNNLHLVGYSIPARKTMSLTELKDHLYTLPNQPNAIPYITSYYEERWGFCLKHEDFVKLEEGQYKVVVDSELFDGSLTYAELFVPGELKEEVFLSTYVCHPSMANNELSGPCVTTFIAKELLKRNRKYSYRIVFIPETIGSITYLSRNIDHLKSNVVAGFNLSCVGDDRGYSYLPSRNGNTLSDQIAKHVLKNISPSYASYSWSDRGSDERQFCAPGVDLPIASIMRTKYGKYDEYHTSLDDLISVVTPAGLEGGFKAIWKAVEALERNCFPKVSVLCEPQLSRRGLRSTLGTKSSSFQTKNISDFLTWSDGSRSLIEIADLCGYPVWDLYPILDKLCEHGLITTTHVRLQELPK